MAFNPFLGQSQEDLESLLQKAQADFARGKIITRATVPGMDVTSSIEMTTLERIRLILVALNKLDPDTYPADQISQATTTRIIFNTSATST